MSKLSTIVCDEINHYNHDSIIDVGTCAVHCENVAKTYHQQANRWRPVSEVPIKGRTITVCHATERWIEAVDYDSYNNYSLNMFEQATHWRYVELPALEGEG